MSGAAARRPLDDRRGLGTMSWIMAVMLFLTVLVGAVFILLNMVSDVVYQMLDPRSNLRRR